MVPPKNSTGGSACSQRDGPRQRGAALVEFAIALPVLVAWADTRRRQRGIAVPLLALAMVAMLTFTGLVVDGSNAFAQRHQMQDAADAAALAGANALNRLRLGASSDPTTIHSASLSEAMSNGADASTFSCQLVLSGGGTQDCPTATNGLTVPANALRVRTHVDQTYETVFMRVVGTGHFSAGASAAAALQRATGGDPVAGEARVVRLVE